MWGLCLGVLLIVSAPTPVLTLELGATTVERAAKAIADKAGVRVSAEPSVAREIVAFSVRDVTLADLLARLADAVGADFETTKEGGYRLFRSEETRRKQLSDHLSRAAKEFARARDELRKGARLDQDGDAAYYRAWLDRQARLADLADEERFFAGKRLDTERSEARFGIRLLDGVRPEDVARIPLGEFRLFRARPTARQFRLDLSDSTAIARFARERSAHVSVKPAPKPGEAYEAIAPVRGDTYRMVHLPLEEPVGDELVEPVVFVGRRLELRGALDMRALAITRTGRFVEVWADLAVPYQGLDGFRVPKPPDGLPCEQDRVHETVNAREFFERTSPTDSPDFSPISEGLSAKLQDPGSHEPWAFVTEALFQIARDGDVNFVFSPNDPTFTSIVRACAPQRAVTELYRALARDEYRLDHRGAWLTIAPADPVAAREAFLDRARLGAYSRAIARQGYADFRTRCLIATPIGVSRFGSPSGFAGMLLGITTRQEGVSNVWPVEDLWKRTLGELPDAQWRALERGEAIAALGLTGAARQAVEALFYGGYLAVLREDASGGVSEGLIGESPTFAYPLALPPSLALSLTLVSEDGLVGVGATSRVRAAEARTLQGWARAQAWRERLHEPPIESVLRPASLLHRTYRLSVGPWYGPYQAEDFVCDFGQPGHTLDALPATIASRYAGLLELERGRANASRVETGQKPPPPPTARDPAGPSKESPRFRIK